MKYVERFGMVPQSWWGNTVTEMLNDLAQPLRRNDYYELPRLLIRDTGTGFELRAALPGYDPESIQAEVTGDFLTLRAEHLEETIQLPSRVDAAKVQARYADGILTITLPRETPAAPENIRITVER